MSITSKIRTGAVIQAVPLHVLLASVRVLARSCGILRIETEHHCWKLLLQNGVVLVEEGRILETFAGKLKSQKIPLPPAPPAHQTNPVGLDCYPVIEQAYRQNPEIVAQVLKSILLETFLALHLGEHFSFVWEPSPEVQLPLPTWPLAALEQASNQEAKQWQRLQRVEHPYQQVQLADAEGLLERVGNRHFPLFARLTTGQQRLSEIATELGQSLFRTAFFFDQLAQKDIVHVLPLSAHQSQDSLYTGQAKAKPAAKLEPEVFVVDDSPVLLSQFRDLLLSWGYRVSCTEQAQQAVSLMMARNPSVVFLDINMPGASGFDLLKQIRRQPKFSSVPLVLMTAERNKANQWRAQWANCRFIAKPRTLAETSTFRAELRIILRNLAPLSTDVLL
ncbi:response regulator [Leptolyngbya sp. FACHB-261]|uniref:response regulator n=1 Tax=Leptolyngbya sp. FACHB-261 TaxID=2692806 RepID=UPI0016868141|nr:response regulator [Leptolyngbya sp. FACHB-261]MBD2104433.1 response regulator [Leptolyngbya sp. FACHB-261]